MTLSDVLCSVIVCAFKLYTFVCFSTVFNPLNLFGSGLGYYHIAPVKNICQNYNFLLKLIFVIKFSSFVL